jgi:hypothetical protein
VMAERGDQRNVQASQGHGSTLPGPTAKDQFTFFATDVS